MMANPAAGDAAGADTIEADDIRRAEEAVGEQTQYTGHSVLGEDVQAVVNLEPVFDCDALAAFVVTGWFVNSPLVA